jgi:hypothetical protein
VSKRVSQLQEIAAALNENICAGKTNPQLRKLLAEIARQSPMTHLAAHLQPVIRRELVRRDGRRKQQLLPIDL